MRHIARDMPLRDVAELVTKHRGQFVAVADHCKQPQVDTKIAPGQGKGIDRPVTPE